ncbi:DNA recombination protein RmuC [Aquirufa sp. ROCK2-A2]
MNIIFIISGAIVFIAFVYFIQGFQIKNLKGQLFSLEEQLKNKNGIVEENKRLFGEVSFLKGQNESLMNNINQLKNDEVKLRKVLTEISHETILKQGKTLNEQQEIKLNDVLNPLKEKLKEFESRIQENQISNTKHSSILVEQIKNLTTLNQTVTQKTEDLTNALKGSNKAQGNWGEMILERVLESSGLIKGREYETQFVTKNQSNEIIKPDAVIFLPDNKNLIIDSKVSLISFDRYTSAEEGSIEKEIALKSHIDSLKTHIKELSAKDYHSGIGLNSPDFTLLFIPIESGFVATISQDTSLFNFAWDKKIVLVSPSTLLATLRTIASVWKTENQTRNAMEIAKKAGELYDKFVAFTSDVQDIGKHIQKAEDAHQAAINKLSTGKGNLITRAQNIRKMGINASKKIHPDLINDESDWNDLDEELT